MCPASGVEVSLRCLSFTQKSSHQKLKYTPCLKIHTCMYAHTHMHAHARTHARTHTHMHTHAHTRTHAHTHAHTPIWTPKTKMLLYRSTLSAFQLTHHFSVVAGWWIRFPSLAEWNLTTKHQWVCTYWSLLCLCLHSYSIAMLSLPQRTSKFLSIQSSFGEILLFRGEKVVLRIPRGEKPTDIYI